MQKESWTLLRLNPANQLRFCDHLADMHPDISTYYPQYPRLTRPHRKRYPIEVMTPVYPGYVFVKLLLDADMIHSVTSCPVKAHFIRMSGQISVVQDSVISYLKELEGKNLLVQEVKRINPYAPGTRVIVHFPIYDIQGIVMHLVGQTRILVDTPLCHVTVPLHHVGLA